MSANKEVRVTFRGIDKTREAFGKIKQNFKQLQNQLGKLKLGFGRVEGAITAAFGTAALKKIIDSGAEIGKLSAKLDISTHSLSELKYAAEVCGVEFETLTSGMQEMAARVSDAARGTGEAAEGLRLLGLSAKELNEVAPNEQLALIAEELIRVSDSADRSQLAVKLFGTEGANLLPLLEQGASGIKKFQEEARKLGVSLSSEECTAMAKFNEELAKLQTVMTSLMTSVLIPILPIITAFFSAIRDGHPAMTFIITAVSALLAFKLAAWFMAVTVAVKGFTSALIANPLGAVVVAITATVAALISLTRWFKRGKESAEDYNKTMAETIKLAKIEMPKQSLEVLSQRNELQNDAKKIFEQTRTPLEKHNSEMEKLNKLLKQGLIDQDTYSRAMDKSSERMSNLGQESEDVFKLIEDSSKDASSALIDNFADGVFGVKGQVKSLKDTFNDFFNQLQADMLKMSLKQGLQGLMGSEGISGMLGGLFCGGGMGAGGMGSGGLGSMFAGCFAKGGKAKAGKAHVVGDGGEPELFIPNSGGSIIPFSQLSAAGSSSPNITVNMNIQTPDVTSFNYSRGQIAADMARQIARSSRNL